jgi:hypothetical protein
MKKLILTFGIVLATLFSVTAQSAAGASKVDQQTEKIMTEYTSVASLTPDQVTKVKPMVSSYLTTKQANKEKYASDADGMKTANKQNLDNLLIQLKTVLSDDQVNKIKAHMDEKKAANKAGK